MTGSDICYTQQVLDGVVPALLQVVQGNCWVIHGASSGRVTAVSLARSLLNLDHKVLAMVSDSGVPGSGEPLPPHVPCSIFRSALDSYWIENGREMIYDAWTHNLYNVDFEGRSKEAHAWVVNARCMEQVLHFIEHAQKMRIVL